MPDARGLRRMGIGFPLRLHDILRGTAHVLGAHVADAAPAALDDLAALALELRGRLGPRIRVAAVVAGTKPESRADLAVFSDAAGEVAGI
jgi:hypothetical protein